MARVLCTALFALLATNSCCAFQTALPMRVGMAQRGLRPAQYRTATDEKPSRDDIKQIFTVRTSQLPLSTLSSLPINYDETLFATPQKLHILPDTAVILKPPSVHPAAATRGLVLLGVLFGLVSLIQKIPGSHNVMAHCVGGAMGGVAALCVSRPGDAMVSGRFSEKVATHGLVKGFSAGFYTAIMTCLAGVSVAGLVGVALASLGTGLVIGMVCKAVERANAIGEGVPLLTRLQTKASLGLFTQEGLFGTSSLYLARDLATCVVQYEAFYLAWVGLCMAYPWMGVTFTGTAVSGAISGVTSLVAGHAFLVLTNLSEVLKKCKELWSGPVKKRHQAAHALDACSVAAVKSAALFVAYKFFYDVMMMGLV